MTDPTEKIRREMVPEMAQRLLAELDAGRPVLTTAQLQDVFEVEGFMAPFVVVRRKSDGKRGSMEFTHQPRFYFSFKED